MTETEQNNTITVRLIECAIYCWLLVQLSTDEVVLNQWKSTILAGFFLGGGGGGGGGWEGEGEWNYMNCCCSKVF